MSLKKYLNISFLSLVCFYRDTSTVVLEIQQEPLLVRLTNNNYFARRRPYFHLNLLIETAVATLEGGKYGKSVWYRREHRSLPVKRWGTIFVFVGNLGSFS